MKVRNEGTILLLIPESVEERKWLMDNTENEDWQWLGPNMVVDHHMCDDLIEGLQEAGFTVEPE